MFTNKITKELMPPKNAYSKKGGDHMAIPPRSTKIDFISEKNSCALDGTHCTVKARIDYNSEVCIVTPYCEFYSDLRPCCVNCLSLFMKKYKSLYQSKSSNH